MKVSYNWLREHLPLELPASELGTHLLRLGFEVAGRQSLGPTFTGVVVAKVVSREKHPNADKLSVCVVDDGAVKRTVVCGAPNVDAGQTVAYARPGAVLPGNFKIEGRKLRGVESQGMICSRAELGLPKDVDGIWVMGEGPELGSDVGSLLGPADDVLDVEIGSNRPDCLSHRGLARELAAYFLKNADIKPLAAALTEAPTASSPVSVEDGEACPFYSARLIEGVKVGESPAWLKAKLEAIGLRPVNNVVDVTNYVLHDLGQPLHAFDADKLAGQKIVVRRSKAGETLLALDHKTYSLPEGLLVIADAQKPVALAGVMGGEETAVTVTTKRVLLEGAYFAPSEARKSSQKTRLRSDSSYRFERGVDPEAVRGAADRAAALILQLAGGSAAKATVVADLKPRGHRIRASVGALNSILGADFPEQEVKRALSSIGELKDEGKEFSFLPPSYRYDLNTANDLAEETGRFLGYDNIPYRMAPMSAKVARVTPVEAESRRARTRLSAMGLWEAYNYDLLAEKELSACRLSTDGQPRVANPLSEDWAVLRPSLLPGLLKNAKYNLDRGADAVRFFEIGKSYATRAAEVDETWRVAGVLLGPALDARWQPARAPRVSFYDAKAVVEDLLEKAGAVVWAKLDRPEAGKTPSDPMFHPANSLRATINGAPVATVGWLHPRVARAYDLDREGAVVFDADFDRLAGREDAAARFKAFSAFPVSRRDLALVLDKGVPYARVVEVVKSCRLEELQDVLLFDVYEGKNIPGDKKSLAVRLTFGRSDRTLTDVEVSKSVDAVVSALTKELGATLRS